MTMSPSDYPNPTTSVVREPVESPIPLLQNVMEQHFSCLPSKDCPSPECDSPTKDLTHLRLRQQLCTIRGQLHEAACWEHVLTHELHEASKEVQSLKRQQQELLIQEASILGRIKKIPDRRPLNPKPLPNPPLEESIRAALSSMSSATKDSLLADLLHLQSEHSKGRI